MKRPNSKNESLRTLLTALVLPTLIVSALLVARGTRAENDTDTKKTRSQLISPLTDPNLPKHVDARIDALNRVSGIELKSAQKKATLSLQDKVGGKGNLKVIYNGLTATPSRILNPRGYLTPPSSGYPEIIARSFIRQWRDLFQFTEGDLNNLKLQSRAVTQEGTTILLYRQMVGEIPVYQGEVLVNVSKNGQIMSVGGMSYPQLNASVNAGISASEAVSYAANAMNISFYPQPIGEAKILSTFGDLKPEFTSGEKFSGGDAFSDDIKVQKVIFPLGSEGRLAYKFVLTTPQYYGIMWQTIVDANSGEILQRLSLTAFQNEQGGGSGNNRRGSFRPDVQNLVESFYHPGGASGKVVDTNPATLSGVGGAGRSTRTGSPGSYVFSKPTFQVETSDSNRFRFSMINARNESPLFFNATGTQTFAEALFPGVLGQVTRGLPDAVFPTSSSPFGWFYLPTGSGGAEITTGDSNRSITRSPGYTMSSEAQTRNLAANSPLGNGLQPYSVDATSLGSTVSLNDGRVLNSVIQSRYTEGNNVVVSDDRQNDNNSTSGIKGYSQNRQFIDPHFDYFSSYEMGGTDASGGGTGGGTVTYPATANPDVYPGDVSLFYFNNISHDYLYSIGFTESMWNFQFDNFGKGGAGGDAIFAEVQDGSGTDNANMGTPDDGGSPRMQMYLFTDGGFRRSDGDFDWDVVAHEQYHGVSNRSAGKGLTSCLGLPLVGEAGGMGEGWSDFIASSMADDDNEGEHVTGDQDRGIRRVPYTNYRYSYGAINNVNLAVRQNISPTDNGVGDQNTGGVGYEVHDVGEVWAAVLWDMRELLIVKQKVGASYPGIFFDGNRRMGGGSTYYIGERAVQSVDTGHPINYRLGFGTDDGTVAPFPLPVLPKLNDTDIVRPAAIAAEIASGQYPKRQGPLATAVGTGARLADKLTLRGLQLAPCNPSFVDMRDSMILADREISGGENVAVIWRAFASHGVGALATSSNSGTGGTGAIAEDFSVPANVSACETQGPLPAPSFSASNTTPNTAMLSITAVSGAADYVVQRSTSASGPFTTIGTATGTSTFTYSDNDAGAGLVVGQTYYYQVHARRNSECVGTSAVQSVTITIGTAPIISPVFFGADSVADLNTGNSLRVDWSAALSSNPNASIVYDVYRVANVALDNDLSAPTFTPGAGNKIAQDLTGTSYVNTGLTLGQQYYYIVRARDTNNGQTDSNNVGNTRTKFNAPTSTTSTESFPLEDFSQASANARFTPPLTDSATPDNSNLAFQKVPNALLSLLNSDAMFAPDYDPGNSGQGGPSNFATLIGPLTLTRGSILEFDHRFSTEAAFDGGNLEVVLGTATVDPVDATPFPNNSTTFDLNDYLVEGGYSGPLNGTLEGGAILSPMQGRLAFTGTQALTHVRAALGDFAPGGVRNPSSLPVYVRFHMSSDVGSNAGAESGWYVDNLVVKNFTEPTTVSVSGTIAKDAAPLSGVSVALAGSATSSTTTNASGQYTFAGVPAGGNYLVTPTLAGHTFEPLSRSYANVSSSIGNADFIAYETANNPRKLTVVNTYGSPTQPVTVPVSISSQGNETSLTFTLDYDPAILSSPVVACGSDAGTCSLEINATVAGKIGINIDPETTFTAGTREVIKVTFNVASTTAPNTPVTFSDSPAVRETSDGAANPLPTTYVNGLVIFAQGLEGDVAPRPNGSGTVTSTDVSQTRSFAVGLETYDQTTNEFQRADTSPLATFGNGVVAATDIAQTRRYQVGLDANNPAQGPVGPNSFFENLVGRTFIKPMKNSLLPRVVRVVSVDSSPNQQVTVSLNVDAEGDEQVYGFSLNYDVAVLSNPLITIGSGATGGNVLPNYCNPAPTCSPGQLGFSIDFPGSTIPAGTNRQLVTIRFDVASNAPVGHTPLTFGDQPAYRETSSASQNGPPQALPTQFDSGFVNILAPSATDASVEGRVLTANGTGVSGAAVLLTNVEGRTVSLRTNSFGYFRFEGVLTGQSYSVSVNHKEYQFTPRVIAVNDNISNLNFIPNQ